MKDIPFEVFLGEIEFIENNSKNIEHFLEMMGKYLNDDKNNINKKIQTILVCFYFRKTEIIRLGKSLDLELLNKEINKN